MKVILLQDVAKIGKRYSVVEVPNGYALNKLIPNQMAEAASAASLKKIERRQAENTASTEAGEARFDGAVTALRAKVLKLATEVNEKGHLFKAVHEADVATTAKSEGVDIEASMLEIPAPIKEVGEHTVVLKVGNKKAEFTIEVVKK